MKKLLLTACCTAMLFGLCACGSSVDTAFNETEMRYVNEICGKAYVADGYVDVTAEALEGREEDFPAVSKVSRLADGNYAFVTEPYGYQGAVTMVIVIDSTTNKTVGMRIESYNEGGDYVRDWTSSWFTDRFVGKDTGSDVKLVKLVSEPKDNEIIAVTGATVSSHATVLGTNAVFGVYKEYVLGQDHVAVQRRAAGSPYEEGDKVR